MFNIEHSGVNASSAIFEEQSSLPAVYPTHHMCNLNAYRINLEA